MREVIATLIKLQTDDGLFEIWESVSLGKRYLVDLNSIEITDGYNFIQNVPWRKEIIHTTEGEWFPTEMLEFERSGGN